MRPTRTTAALVAGLGLLLPAMVACGDDDESDATDEPVATTTADTASTTDEAADGQTVEIVATDFAFGGVPDTIEPGTRLTLTNESTAEVHEVVAVLLPDDEDRPLAELASDPATLGGLLGGGPPAAVIVAAPGTDTPGAVLGDGSLTEPGRYLLVCTIPTGADPDAYLEAAAQSTGGPPDVPGGPPHFVQGMVAEISVAN